MTEQHGPIVPVVPQSRGQQIRRAIASATAGLSFVWLALQTAAPQLQILMPQAKWIPELVGGLGIIVGALQKLKDAGSIVPVNLSGPVASLPPTADLRQSIPAGPSMASPTGTVYPEVSSLPAVLPLIPDEQQQNRTEGE